MISLSDGPRIRSGVTDRAVNRLVFMVLPKTLLTSSRT